MLDANLKQRLSKVYELVKRGATEGERAAAQAALDKLLGKYNLTGIDLDSLDREIYKFKYSTTLEEWLLLRILKVMIDDDVARASAVKQTYGVRQIRLHLRYLDYITVSCAYEYFRRHMKQQWNKLCAAELKKKRKAKTRNQRREELQSLFFDRYIIASKLYKEEELTEVDLSQVSDRERRDRYNLEDIEGGAFATQVQSGHLLN